jgi:hypothetical protein
MIVEHPNGTLFIVGYGGGHPNLWSSTDHGAHWSKANVGTEADGAIGNSDVDLAVAPDGTIYFINMSFDRKALEGTMITMGVSRDAGASWKWQTLSKKRFDDRPWVAVAPNGSAYAIWNDGSGVFLTSSHDKGKTWSEPARVNDEGGSSHLAVGSHGEIAIRITPLSASGKKFTAGVDLIAISTDSGRTWQTRTPPGTRDWGAFQDNEWPKGFTPRWVEPLAWDHSGALYYFWTEKNGGWIGRSADEGRTWKTWHVLKSSEPLYFPYLNANDRGDLAMTWFSGSDESQRFHVGLLNFSKRGGSPQLVESGPQEADIWNKGKTATDPPVRDTGGEYLPVIFLGDNLAVVTPIQHANREHEGFAFWTFQPR